jgi:hypothetical protein
VKTQLPLFIHVVLCELLKDANEDNMKLIDVTSDVKPH